MPADHKFEIVNPSSWDKLTRKTMELGAIGLAQPYSTSPLALIDGELVAVVGGKFVRATDPTKPSFFSLEDRGDPGMQAARKLSAVVGGGAFWAATVLFDPSLTVEGTPVMLGSVTYEGQVRAGLVPWVAGSGNGNIVKGHVIKPAAINQGKLLVRIIDN